MTINIHVWLGCLLLLCTLGAQSAVYKWTDAEGRVHYSDLPTENGNEPNNYDQSAAYDKTAKAQPQDQAVYTRLDIILPQKGQIINNDKGTVPVSLILEPALKYGDKIQLNIDGGLIPGRFISTQITVEPVAPGNHTIAAAVVDSYGEEKISSKRITFSVHKSTEAADKPY